MARIPTLTADTDPDNVAQALDKAGAVVVTDILNAERRDAIRAELAPHMEAARVIDKDDPTQFYPGRTRRASALVACSPTVGDLVVHDTSKAMCNRLLIDNGPHGYQLHVSAALEVGPGARKQILHREEDSFTFFPHPRPNLIVASMWAISDFRADNGATQIVPGSHKWPEERRAKPEEIVLAEMPAGSVLYWMGGTLHGAGANTAEDWRYGVILTYSLGWLRQEENQYLDVPPNIAKTLSPELQHMIGYKMYRALGFSIGGEVAPPDDLEAAAPEGM